MQLLSTYLLLLLVLVLLEKTYGSACGCEDPNALWCDEFSDDTSNHILNENYWTHDLGGGGWGNYEAQIYNRENAPIAGGQLRIHATKDENNNYYSSRIQTKNKVEFLYVRLEASIKVTNL